MFSPPDYKLPDTHLYLYSILSHSILIKNKMIESFLTNNNIQLKVIHLRIKNEAVSLLFMHSGGRMGRPNVGHSIKDNIS